MAEGEKIEDGNMAGFVKSVGWVKKRGKETFQAVIEYPNGPPPGLMFSVVFDKPPVAIVTLDEVAALLAARKAGKP